MNSAIETNCVGSLVIAIGGFELSEIEAELFTQGLGGAVLLDRNIATQSQVRTLTDSIHSLNPKAIIMVDEEGGTVSRLDKITGGASPSAQALGFIDDTDLTLEIAAWRGRFLDESGIDMCLAPVADLVVGAGNPVVASRSFGADPALVARHVTASINGTRAAGVAACVKHFPGHGITLVDTHEEKATAIVEEADVRSIHFTPFKAAIQAGVDAVMTGHVVVPAWDKLPASLSSRAHEVLRTDLGFDGLVVSDAIDMAGVGHAPQEAAIRALEGGADLVLLGNRPPDQATLDAILASLERAMENGTRLADRMCDVATRRAEFARPRSASTGGYPDRRQEAAERAISVSLGGFDVPSPVHSIVVAKPSWIQGLNVSHDLTAPAASAFPTARVTTDENRLDEADLLVTHDSAFDAQQQVLIASARKIKPSTLVVETGVPPAGLAPPNACLRGASQAAFKALARSLGKDRF